jgi:pSer/pThr/pTyr-binding forkhead associated (FHA) protein
MMVIIGRATDCDIVLDHNTVSRRHAVLIRSHHGWTIEDLGSTNGTAVNGVRIRDRRSVRVGDVLQFGATARRLGRDGLCDD